MYYQYYYNIILLGSGLQEQLHQRIFIKIERIFKNKLRQNKEKSAIKICQYCFKSYYIGSNLGNGNNLSYYSKKIAINFIEKFHSSKNITFLLFFSRLSNNTNLRHNIPLPSSSPLIIYSSFLFDRISQNRIVLSVNSEHITFELPQISILFTTNGEYTTVINQFLCLLNT
ncbi:hypothetical protein RFI_27577 [Reticulomyxa filosa]|uniref:Uncharacterized protein n=1 Tax=Reticulomyxa filosa TaxID=46433 RepID=X6M838_RETFI|nr:hypothetical protein RFI_27577 [Reticulomyxa filosa]|eukprot:ETO09801.1 hypothetical protein RFI_27577 [Reticulomyxa filosa]